MIDNFIKTIERHGLIEKGDGVVVGVSGGPDSICLLHLLWRIQKEYDLRLFAVHLNHQFRGLDADGDASYVKEFCNQYGLPAFLFTENIAEYAFSNKITDEEAGRDRRYHYFHEVLHSQRAQKIAVAQNKKDQAETVLMRLMRGAGIEGLSAMDYKRDNCIIRPLLDSSRMEIESYCIEQGLKPRMDKTNLQTVYARNRVRLELIPYIEENFNENITDTLCRTADLLREDSQLINQLVALQYENVVRKLNQEILITKKDFEKQHIAIKKRIIRQGMKELAGSLKDIENKHIEYVLELIRTGQVGGEINLPNRLTAKVDYEVLRLRHNYKSIIINNFEYKIVIGESIHLREINRVLATRILDCSQIPDYSIDNETKYVDFNKIKNTIIVRNRRAGDRFNPLGMSGSKKLKDFFIDEKIPKDTRDHIPLVCDGDEIIWVVGYRISEKYKIGHDTKVALEITFKNEE